MKKNNILVIVFLVILSFGINQGFAQTTYTWNYMPPNPPFWGFASNWSPMGVPTANDNVVIDVGAPYPTVLNGYAVCNNLIIEPQASITINLGGILTVSGDMLMESDETGTAWLMNNGTMTINGTSTVQQYIEGTEYPAGNDKWHLISQPVASINSTAVFLNCYLKEFNAITGIYEDVGPDQTLNTIMKGYSVMNTYYPGATDSKTLEFTGTLNNGDYSINLVNAGEGWCLVGNPYPSSIDWDNAGWTRTNIGSTVYVWNSAAGNFITWNGVAGDLTDGIIPPMQAFFVQATGNNPVIGVTNSVRTSSPQVFYENTTQDLLSLTVTGSNGYFDKAFVNFNSNSTVTYDKNFDSYKMEGGETAPQLFSIIQEYKLTVNVLPEITETTEINIGCSCGLSGDYSINAEGIDSFDTSVRLLLKDIKENTTIDLRKNAVYNFNYSTDDETHRFILYILSSS